MYSNEYKQQVYKKFIENGRIMYDIDKSKEPTEEERKIILELGKRENARSNSNIELEKRTAEIRKKYQGMISDKIFDALNNY